jgi:hypothetical protein
LEHPRTISDGCSYGGTHALRRHAIATARCGIRKTDHLLAIAGAECRLKSVCWFGVGRFLLALLALDFGIDGISICTPVRLALLKRLNLEGDPKRRPAREQQLVVANKAEVRSALKQVSQQVPVRPICQNQSGGVVGGEVINNRLSV